MHNPDRCPETQARLNARSAAKAPRDPRGRKI
jgi:hypothetical protein